VDDLLRDLPDVMNWRIQTLLRKDQDKPFPELKISKRGDSEEDEQSI
jgi:hypothetical protein